MDKCITPQFQDQYRMMYPEEGNAKSVTFIVTHQCNLRCTYCYEISKSNEVMTFETAKKCVDLLFQEDEKNSLLINPYESNGIILDFIGGEPLLEIDLIDKIMSYFLDTAIKKKHRWATKYMISISSNGVLYNQPSVKKFLNKFQGRVNLGITIDGDEKTHDSCRVDCNGCGSYKFAAQAFKDQISRGQRGTKFTIAPGNVDKVYSACKDIIEKFNLKELYCNCVYEEGWNENHAKILYYQLKKLSDWLIESDRYKDTFISILDQITGKSTPETKNDNWCGGTGKMLAFDVDGTIYPCLRYSPMSVPNQEPFRIGDITNGIGNLKDDKTRIQILESITRLSQSSEECISCPISDGCGWCSAYNYQMTGTPNQRVTFICPMHKARVLAVSYYRNKILQKENKNKREKLNIPKEQATKIIGEDEYNYLLQLSK